jgi:Fe-S cluster biogenesis protein NfuA
MASADPADLKARIETVLIEEIGPALQLDGTAIKVLDVTDGVAQLQLGGVCGGCPSSIVAVIMGIEQELRRRVPEVQYVEAIG